jgi:hypothetical protein
MKLRLCNRRSHQLLTLRLPFALSLSKGFRLFPFGRLHRLGNFYRIHTYRYDATEQFDAALFVISKAIGVELGADGRVARDFFPCAGQAPSRWRFGCRGGNPMREPAHRSVACPRR